MSREKASVMQTWQDHKGNYYGVAYDIHYDKKMVKCNGECRLDISKGNWCWAVVQAKLDKYAIKHGWRVV